MRTKEDRCELKQVPEAQVEAAVLQLLQEHISAVVELDRCLSEIQQVPYQKINVAKCEQRREKLAAEIARYRDLKASLYEDMKEGLISKTDFCDIRGQYDARIADALIAQEQIDRELSIYLSGEQSPNNWMKTFTEHRGLKSLTRAVVLECIEKVVIHKDEKLEIIFEHSEDYARLVEQPAGICRAWNTRGGDVSMARKSRKNVQATPAVVVGPVQYKVALYARISG